MTRDVLARWATPIGVVFVIAAGALATPFAGGAAWRHRIWMAGLVVTALPILWQTARGMVRGRFAADLVASLAVIAALLLVQPIVGLVIVLMQSGGEALEKLAAGRASEALRALEEAAPRTVHRMSGAVVEDVDVDEVQRGESVLVRPGELIPCDGEVVSGRSQLDTSSLTGEPMPVPATRGTMVMSGSVNQEGPLVIRVLALARESQYAKIVALVREAQASKTPLQRIADRYAVMFTPLTLALCAAAYWGSGDWDRVLAVLAVATPCPLILATPVAVLGGMNRSARRQILVRNGGALEALGSTTAVVFDKTGTLTIGRPRVAHVIALDSTGETELLRLAAGVEHLSGHLLARTVVEYAESRGVAPPLAENVVEDPGRGVDGIIEGRHVAVGSRSYIVERLAGAAEMILRLDAARGDSGSLRAYVAIDGGLAGLIDYADMIRPNMASLITRLSDLGVRRMVLLSGDRAENARAVAASVGIREAHGDMLPEEKVNVVEELIAAGERVIMLGDGTNDAPALSAAHVGVALAAHGRGIATEAADVILLADDPARVADAIEISRWTMRIARQSIIAGLGISAVGMAAAALGMIPPIAGAMLQEAVDLAVIANALRASYSGKSTGNPGNMNGPAADGRLPG